ncbi:MAG: YgaP family membrane protein [Anaerolineae bacterium]
MGFAKFMASMTGRGLRVVAGIALILVGFLTLEGVTSYIVMAVGLVPLLAGVFDVCLFAPLLGGSFKGSDARNQG